MPISLLDIPPEVIEHIALCSGVESTTGPPASLVALSSVNRSLRTLLAITNNDILYAQIYLAKFDPPIEGAVSRSLVSSSPLLAAELHSRFCALRRFRMRYDSCGLSPRAERLAEMLPMAYIMCLENDEKNLQQLREYAHIDDWLREYWTSDDGSSTVQETLKLTKVRHGLKWPDDHAVNTLAMWVFWFVLQPQELLADHTGTWNMMNIVKLFSLGSHKYPLENIPWPDLRPDLASPLADYSIATAYFSRPFSLIATPIAIPATLTYLTLLDSVQETILYSPSSFRRTAEWRQLKRDELRVEWLKGSRPLHDANGALVPHLGNRLTQSFACGSIEGIWEGIFTYMEFETYAEMLSGASPAALQRSLIVRHWQTWKLREYYFYSSSSTPEDEPQEPLSEGDPLRAWLPQEATFAEPTPGILKVWDPVVRKVLQYSRRSESPEAEGKGEVLDVIIKGEGHSAWGQFNIYGRIRPCDGMFCFSKEYMDGDRGVWIYRGSIVGNENGQLAGRWRDTMSMPESTGYEGGFIMKRRR